MSTIDQAVCMRPAHGDRRRRAIVYNNNLSELGGGERSTLAYAKALQQLGYAAEVLSTRPVPSPQVLAERFGAEFSAVPIHLVPIDAADDYLRARDVAVFVNHTFMSFLPNAAPLGIYSQMFPLQTLRLPEHAREVRALQTYQLLLCNSAFTQTHTRERWPDATCRLEVLRPPIGCDAVERARRAAADPPRKVKQFVHVGRFNPILHNKNQVLIIEHFLQARAQYPILHDWRLLLIGGLGPSPAARQYYAQCEALTTKAAGVVTLRPNLAEADLRRELDASFAYVHATGAFLPSPQAPEACEHFGLSIIEAMAHGCLALAYGRGGVWEIAADGPGFHGFGTAAALIEGYAQIASLYGSREAVQLARANAAQASVQGFDQFRRRLQALLERTPGRAVSPQFAR
jgi:glycosyltransferase involved in cell wall biosynthesis